jgi:hypothetical protein
VADLLSVESRYAFAAESASAFGNVDFDAQFSHDRQHLRELAECEVPWDSASRDPDSPVNGIFEGRNGKPPLPRSHQMSCSSSFEGPASLRAPSR